MHRWDRIGYQCVFPVKINRLRRLSLEEEKLQRSPYKKTKKSPPPPSVLACMLLNGIEGTSSHKRQETDRTQIPPFKNTVFIISQK